MKVGTDAVLLGAWVDVGNAETILDIGTGCGVIALMLAQRTKAFVDAVEPDENSARQASENFKASSWSQRIGIHHTSIQKFEHVPFDLIVSNPPFFSNSLLPPSAGRQVARHTETLSFEELLTATKRLLTSDGRFAVVLPVAEGNTFREAAARFGLGCHRSMAFYSRDDKPQERWLMEFSTNGKTTPEEALILYDNRDAWTGDYTRLTAEFYL